MRLIYEFKKERYKEIIDKSLNNTIKSSNYINRSDAYKSFILISIPIFIMISALKYILTGFNLHSDDIVQIMLCIVLFYFYFEILLKIIPRILKKLLKNRLETLFESKISNMPEITKIILEIDNISIKYNRENYSEEIVYDAIDEINIIDDFIEIKYIKDHLIHIPVEAFEDKNNFEECYEILKKNKEINNEIRLTIDNSDFTFVKTEDDIINYNKYMDSTEFGKFTINILNEYLIKVTGIIMIFIWIIILCMAGFYWSLLVILINFICDIVCKKTNVMKKFVVKNEIKLFKESENKVNKYIKVKDDVIEFSTDEYSYSVKYKGIANIIEQNNLILLLKNELLIEYIPCRIFKNLDEKEKFYRLVKEKIINNDNLKS